MAGRSHVLLVYAEKYPRCSPDLTPPGCRYDTIVGAWRLDDDVGTLLAEHPLRTAPRTKKQDVETGEDQKGA